MSSGHWGNVDDRGRAKNSDKNPYQYYFVYHKSHMDQTGMEPGPPIWQPGDYPPEP